MLVPSGRCQVELNRRKMSWGSFKGSFQGNIDIGIDIDVDMDVDMAVSMNWGSFKRGLQLPLTGLGLT